MTMRILPALALAALVAACAASNAPDGPRLYLLEADAPAAPAQPVAVSVGVREVGLPLYARRDRIAAQADGAITASDEHRWAEEPPRAATRLIARRLGASTGADVFVEPWTPGAGPDVIVTIVVDRFIGSLGGEATLAGQATLVRADRRGSPRTVDFALSAPAGGADYGALTSAYGDAMAQLADLIAAEVAAFASR